MRRNALIAAILFCWAGLSCWGQPVLEPSGLALLNCRPVTTAPCFRLQFRISGTVGGLADITGDQLARSITVIAESFPVRTFDARVGVGGTARSVDREAPAQDEVRANMMQVTVTSPYADLASLDGRTLDFDLALQLPDGQIVRPERLVRWRSGDMSSNYEDSCDRDERAKSPAGVDLVTIWRPILVFVAFSCVLLALAFWLPRMIWPPTPPDDLRPVRRNAG